MANDAMSGWQPEWSVRPGEILLEALEDRGMTQSELARRTARPLKTINEIINGRAAITAETAIQLERALGISAGFWTGLETRFRDQLARQQAKAELEAHADWVDDFPLRDLVRHKLIGKTKSKAALLGELLSYFRDSSPEGFERQWLDPAAAFRASRAFRASPKAVAAWLRWGEIEASRATDVAPFDAGQFRAALREIRTLTRRTPFMQTVKKVESLCREAGVIVLVLPEFENTHLSGATRWIGARPVIQLNLRHKSEDHFWFTFFHEADHVLNSPRRREYVDGMDLESADLTDADEASANAFARNWLLPPDVYDAFAAQGDFSPDAVRAFANAQQLAPGIVVARLQQDDRVLPSQLNFLKQAIRWSSENG